MKGKIRNYFYGVGTLGRDMVYALTSMYLMYYLTDVVGLSGKGIGVVTTVMVVFRIFDALNDPYMGYLVDNTRTRFGKFKPWMIGGGFLSGIITILLFYQPVTQESLYLIYFSIIYLFWGITFTIHDISYWSMLPSLSKDGKVRERIGAIARMCADVGLFSVVVGIVPLTNLLSSRLGGLDKAYFVFACVVAILMVVFLLVVILFVREDREYQEEKSSGLSDIIEGIFQNDQLLWIVLSLLLFTIASTTTTSFGIYYFQYIFGDIGAYSRFAGILGISQLLAVITFPFLSERLGRKNLYKVATFLVCLGYSIFYFATSMTTISIAGCSLFFGNGLIQILMLMFIADCVEYGEFKQGKRKDSITLSLRPFIAKMGSAIGAGVVGFSLVLSHINQAATPKDLTQHDIFIFKMAMFGIPLVIIVIGYVIYALKYKIDEAYYRFIIEELEKKKEVGRHQ